MLDSENSLLIDAPMASAARRAGGQREREEEKEEEKVTVGIKIEIPFFGLLGGPVFGSIYAQR